MPVSPRTTGPKEWTHIATVRPQAMIEIPNANRPSAHPRRFRPRAPTPSSQNGSRRWRMRIILVLPLWLWAPRRPRRRSARSAGCSPTAARATSLTFVLARSVGGADGRDDLAAVDLELLLF